MIRIIINKNKSYHRYEYELNKEMLIYKSDAYWLSSKLKTEDIDVIDKHFVDLSVEFTEFVKSMDAGKIVHMPLDISDQSSMYLTVRKINQRILNVYASVSTVIDAVLAEFKFNQELILPNDNTVLIFNGFIVETEKFQIDFTSVT